MAVKQALLQYKYYDLSKHVSAAFLRYRLDTNCKTALLYTNAYTNSDSTVCDTL